MKNELPHEKLADRLSKVQKETSREAFIYGVTSRAGRKLFTRINDFFIDQSRVPLKEKAYFFELLATMLSAGIPLNKSLQILSSRTEHRRLARIIATLAHELEHGRPFSTALDRFPDVFDETERGAIRSSEAVGTLQAMLAKIAANAERRTGLRRKLAAALIYPAAVLVSLIIAAGVMLVFVVPRMREMFETSSVALPAATRFLLAASTFLNEFWWLLLIIVIFAAAFFHLYTHSEDGRFSWDFWKLRIPLVGTLLRKICVIRFTDTLGILTESGLPINQTLEHVADAVGNEAYRLKTYEALGRVQEGQSLSGALGSAPFLFPETVTNILAVGEHAASLGATAQKIGAHYEREIDHTLNNLTTVLGPVLILGIGAAVAFFSLAVMSPIFSLTQNMP